MQSTCSEWFLPFEESNIFHPLTSNFSKHVQSGQRQHNEDPVKPITGKSMPIPWELGVVIKANLLAKKALSYKICYEYKLSKVTKSKVELFHLIHRGVRPTVVWL